MTHGVDLSDLFVSPQLHQTTFCSLSGQRYPTPVTTGSLLTAVNNPSTTTAMADKFPHSLALLCNYRGSVDCATDDFQQCLIYIHRLSVAQVVVKKHQQKCQCPVWRHTAKNRTSVHTKHYWKHCYCTRPQYERADAPCAQLLYSLYFSPLFGTVWAESAVAIASLKEIFYMLQIKSKHLLKCLGKQS